MLTHETSYVHEIVANTRRFCLMNMFLHNIGEIDGGVSVSPADALVAPSAMMYDNTINAARR